MPKKSSSKAPTKKHENNSVEEEKHSSVQKKAPTKKHENNSVDEEKHSSVQKKASKEIDEIFAGIKRKKSEPGKIEKPNEVANPKKMKKKKDKGSDDGGFVDQPSRLRKRKTNDGFTIYKAEDLGINADAGGTPLCPFDCSCCF